MDPAFSRSILAPFGLLVPQQHCGTLPVGDVIEPTLRLLVAEPVRHAAIGRAVLLRATAAELVRDASSQRDDECPQLGLHADYKMETERSQQLSWPLT